MILIPSPDSMHELQRVWWRDVPTLDVFHIVILLFLPRSGSISLTPLTGHWPCEAKSPDPWAWATWRTCMRSRSIFFYREGSVAALWYISSNTYEWLVLRLPTFTSTRNKFTNCVMPRPRHSAGFALMEHPELNIGEALVLGNNHFSLFRSFCTNMVSY